MFHWLSLECTLDMQLCKKDSKENQTPKVNVYKCEAEYFHSSLVRTTSSLSQD